MNPHHKNLIIIRIGLALISVLYIKVSDTAFAPFGSDEEKGSEAVISEMFDPNPRPNNAPPARGPLGGSDFITYSSVWITEFWNVSTPGAGTTTVIRPSRVISDRDFSDIQVTVQESSKEHNAQALFDVAKSTSLNAEILSNNQGDLKIYRIENMLDEDILETFYIDARGKTGSITFLANKNNFSKYNVMVLELVKSFAPSK